MTIPYNEPGVTIRELESPSFNIPSSGAPTLPAIVGPSRGYRDVTDIIQLVDNTAVTLSASNIDTSTLVVVDAADPNGTAFEVTTTSDDLDYTLSTTDGVTTIVRTMQTTIADGEEVVTYFENLASETQGTSFTKFVTLDRLGAEYVDGTADGSVQASTTQTDSLRVQNKGQFSVDDYTLADEGGAAPTIIYNATNGVMGKFQTVYLDYDIATVAYVDQAYQLNYLTDVSLPAGADNIVVKNAPDLGSGTLDEVALYSVGVTDTLDYILTGSGASLKLARSQGTTTIGDSDDELRVRVTYRATPDDYWVPTRVFSPAEAEAKFGPALDANGNINSPLSFAAGLAFANGAPELVLQALFAAGPGDPTGEASDWTATLQALRVQEDVNVIVPIVSVGGSVVTSNDSAVRSAISACLTHVDYQRTNNIYAIVIAGTDSTVALQGAQATRRSLAQAFADEDVTIVSPASFTYVNNLNRSISVGGQYAAAALAGLLCRYSVQSTMTRKSLFGLVAVNEVVERLEKNRDAASGLTVLENSNGRIRVRHALTTDVSSVSKSELNVVRSKHFLVDTVHDLFDEQIIGQVPADEDAPITVMTALNGVLESMKNQGVIAAYAGIHASMSTTNPTQVNVRFAYKPPFAINYISVEFSIDLGQGSISLSNTPTAGA